MKALDDIRAERRRQIDVEGWSPEHDDTHVRGEMARAAVCYAYDALSPSTGVPKTWPWSSKWWKPKNRRHNLVRAGALIVAEIERLDRADASAPSKPPACAEEKGLQRGILEKARAAVACAAKRHEGDDAYSQGLDKGARDQVEACLKAIDDLLDGAAS